MVMAIEVLQNEEISGGRKNGEGKGVDSAVRRGGANRGARLYSRGIHVGGVLRRNSQCYAWEHRHTAWGTALRVRAAKSSEFGEEKLCAP